MSVTHIEDVPVREVENGDVAHARRRLGAAAGARRAGLSRFEVPAGARQMPVHVHGDEDEVFFVLGGSGLSWQGGDACEVRPGDAVVHVANGAPHTFLAGAEGLDLLAFAHSRATNQRTLQRAKVMWAGPRWVPTDGPHPFAAEAAAGPLERSEPGDQPPNVVALAEVGVDAFPGVAVRQLGAAGGSRRAGLNHVVLDPGAAGAPPHCHSLEEELFAILAGSGTLTLGDEAHPLRVGDTVARPPATGVPHALTAGADGMTYLVFGTREAGDSVYYPQAGKVWLRGLGVRIDVPT